MGFEALTQGILAGAQGIAGGIERRADDLKQAKVADAFVKANENVLGELGIDKDAYSALSARDRSAAVMGYMKNLGVQEAVYKQQEMKRALEVRKSEQAVMPHLQDLLRNAPEDAQMGSLLLKAMAQSGVSNPDVFNKYSAMVKLLNEDRSYAADFKKSVLAMEAMKTDNKTKAAMNDANLKLAQENANAAQTNNQTLAAKRQAELETAQENAKAAQTNNKTLDARNQANYDAVKANTAAVEQRTKFEEKRQKEWESLSQNRKAMAALKKSAAELGNKLTNKQVEKLGKEVEFLKEPPTVSELKEMKAIQVKDEDGNPTPFYLAPDGNRGHRLMHAGSDSNDSGLYDDILSQVNLSPAQQAARDSRLAAISADLEKLYAMPDGAMVDFDGRRVDKEIGKGAIRGFFTAGEMSKTEAIQRLLSEKKRLSGNKDSLGILPRP